jgi:hypothetical protein
MASRVLSKIIGKNLPADQLVKTWKIIKGDTVRCAQKKFWAVF